ncbi:EriC Chloride channel protein EriC [Pyrenophora tritici-repentis]|nr:EriC Chloride channel protein EriC [Pyrenophora tritici-repentis]KAI1551510.1 EriC Chloride channel protein EriC [Pyrenophora tritici-repentis]KAI1557390.1 EriC Chloride channel protein EriC [Pyrenophora tritici-repentis]KAI1578358.1 EriC Chloride channel protein EriC [Pyrenophora tritici-repentis]KAI1586773.1 EriC Chloride channel protein EriC [Pyrenophora tritici-repentis]
MASDSETGNERTPLLTQPRLSQLQHQQNEEMSSIVASTVTKEERRLADSTVGERLPYNDYTTIDWLHDLVKDSYRFRHIQSRRGLRYTLIPYLDACSGWIAVVVIGALTACVAFVVDIAVATVSDWKVGYCSGHVFRNRDACCMSSEPQALGSFSTPSLRPWLRIAAKSGADQCANWHSWSEDYTSSFAIYVGTALIFGILSSSITMLTKTTLPSASAPDASPSPSSPTNPKTKPTNTIPPQGKTLYPTSGSGIPELKTLLSGFTIPSLLTFPVLLTKSLGAIFAVSANLCLGKEGPFVHISTCLGHLIGHFLPKYSGNGRKMRELLSASCSAGLSVAFGAPIGGVLFSYEESADDTVNWKYVGWLVYGTIAKLVLTTITFGIKVPSGVIIPALDAGALFGRLVGQLIGSISPGIFAMVGAAAFLAGVSRMTISLAVIMFELTGQLSYTVPSMLAILIAKWVADAISLEGVYDIAQTLLSHPFLDPDTAIAIVRQHKACVQVLIPPKRTMDEITVHVPISNKVDVDLLTGKLNTLKERGLMDAGLVLVQDHGGVPILQGYISQAELEFGLTKLVPDMLRTQDEILVRLLGHQIDDGVSPQSLEMDLTPFVDRTPLTICAKAPLEYAVEMFSKLGLRYLMVTEEGTGQLY